VPATRTAVTLEIFRNGLKLAENKGVLSGTGRDAHERRKAFAQQLRGLIDYLDTLATIQRMREWRSS
jgi:hypothetical protein